MHLFSFLIEKHTIKSLELFTILKPKMWYVQYVRVLSKKKQPNKTQRIVFICNKIVVANDDGVGTVDTAAADFS